MKKVAICIIVAVIFLNLGACTKNAATMYFIPNYGSYYSNDNDLILVADAGNIKPISCDGWEVSLDYAVFSEGKLNIAVSSLTKSVDVDSDMRSGGTYILGESEGVLWINDVAYHTTGYTSWYNLPIAKRDEYVFEVDDVKVGDLCKIQFPIKDTQAEFVFDLTSPMKDISYIYGTSTDEITVYAERRHYEGYQSVNLYAVTRPGYEVYRYGSASSLNKNVLSGPIISEANNIPPSLKDIGSGIENHSIIRTAPRGFAENRFLYATDVNSGLTLEIPHITLQTRENYHISEQFEDVESLAKWQYKLETKHGILNFRFDTDYDGIKLYCDVWRSSDTYLLVGIDFIPECCDMTNFNYQLDMFLNDGFSIAVDKFDTDFVTVDVTAALPEDFEDTYKLEITISGIKYTIPETIEVVF